MRRQGKPLRVLVVGGGVAAAELLLSLRALAEDRVEIELVAPSARLPFRPAATTTALDGRSVPEYDLRQIASDAGARFRLDSVEAVAPRAHRARLASGTAAGYDVLVLAVGARARVGVPGALTFRDHRDSPRVAALMNGLGPYSNRLVFVAPTGVSWTLPLYELALFAAGELTRRDEQTEIVVLTPENAPLEVFGPGASRHVASLLRERSIRKVGGSAQYVARGRVVLSTGEALSADAVVAVPRLVGRRIAGVPADWNGFVRTDPHGRVAELEDVYAAGDVTAFPVKQGGIATQQADVIAAVLARRAGAAVEPPSGRSVLRARLLGTDLPCFLRSELDELGRPLPTAAGAAVSEEAEWWPPAKLFGRHLTPWMATRGLLPV